MSNKATKIVGMADGHAGHRVGLTPPKFQSATRGDKYYRIQIDLWNEFERMIDRQKPIDILIYNGDAIDGKGPATQSTELIYPDINTQIDIACETINYCEADTVLMTHGTRYHIGPEDPEKRIAKEIGAKHIGGHLWFDSHGVTFDCKHYIGGTTVPHTKGTALARERLWNLLWSEHEEAPKSDVIIRSHRHNFHFCGEDNWLSMAIPALQGQGSKINRIVSGTVQFGIVFFNVRKNGTYGWGWDIPRVISQKIEPLKL